MSDRVFPPHVFDHELPPPVDARSGVPRREDDRRLYAFFLTLIVTAFTAGIAWATANAAVHQKLDRSDQLVVDSRQDGRIERLESEFSAVLDGMRGLKVGVDSANLRLRQMACDNRPPSCR